MFYPAIIDMYYVNNQCYYIHYTYIFAYLEIDICVILIITMFKYLIIIKIEFMYYLDFFNTYVCNYTFTDLIRNNVSFFFLYNSKPFILLA